MDRTAERKAAGTSRNLSFGPELASCPVRRSFQTISGTNGHQASLRFYAPKLW
ncbi:hypothetical protein RUM43_002959, partial [Polyplax serrata]